MKVSGLTTIRTSRQANSFESNTRVKRAAGFARRGSTWRSRYKDNCLRRKRFSAARRHRGCRLALTSLGESSHRSNVVRSSLKKGSSFGMHDRIAQPGHRVTKACEIATYRIIAEHR